MRFLQRLIDNLLWPVRRVLSSPMMIFSAPRKLMGLSLPFRLALFSLLFLILCAVLGCVLFLATDNRAALAVYLRSWWLVLILLIVIPIAVYKVMQSWLQGEPSRFPKIDQAWEAGMEAMQDHYIDVTEVPLFLVTGLEDDKHARRVMEASGQSFAANGVPEGPAPIHWFASDTAIFLCLTQTSCVGQLIAKFNSSSGPGESPALQPAAKGMFSETMTLGDQPGGGGFTETADFGENAPNVPEAAPPPPAMPEFTGTVGVIDPSVYQAAGLPAQGSHGVAVVKLNDKERRETEEQLEYVLEKLRVAREPFSPVNGMLNLIPFNMVRHSGAQAEELKQIASRDLELIRETLRVRCSTSVVIDGMESESGFRELARRIGRDTVKKNRFGKGNPDVWTPATPDNVEAIVRHACGAFEDWAYHLFGVPGGLSKLGNTKLYSLLCLVRTEIQERLIDILCHVYGRDSDDARVEPHSMMFSGCYFAATGDSDDKQAFIKSVFDKLLEQEEKLCWTDEALAEADRYRVLGNVANFINLGLLVAIVGVVLSSSTTVRKTMTELLGTSVER
jgi:hypothetical protein